MQAKNDRTYWKLDPEFMCIPQLQNPLPCVTPGIFISKDINFVGKIDDVTAYTKSALEKNYVWKAHFGIDAGLGVDMVDQDAVVPEVIGKISPDDLKYLHSLSGMTSKSNSKSFVKDKAKSGVKPWWLRNTTYLENNLFESTTNFKKFDNAANRLIRDKKYESHLQTFDAKVRSSFSTAAAVESFGAVVETENKYISENAQGKRKLEWVLPLIPHGDNANQIVSFVRFDEDPIKISKSGDGSGFSATDDELNRKRLRMSVATNARKLSTDDVSAKSVASKSNVFAVSLIAPAINSTTVAADAEEDDLFGEPEQTVSQELDPIKYSFIRDYTTEIQNSNLQDAYVLLLDTKESKSAMYLSLKSQLEMKRMVHSSVKPVKATVLRGA